MSIGNARSIQAPSLLGDVFGWRQHPQGGNTKTIDSSSRNFLGVIKVQSLL